LEKTQECSAKKRGVGTPSLHQMKRKTAPNSSNEVSVCLQEFSHWIFLFHCRLLSSSANQRVTITYVRSQPCFNGVQKGVETPFWGVPTPLHHWKSPTARPSVQVTMKAARQHFSPRASFKHIFDLFHQNGSRTYRGPRASADRVNVLSLLYILRVLSHYCNVKWTMKRPFHHWNHIMKLIL